MTPHEIEAAVTRLVAQPKPDRSEARDVVGALLAALESGAVRAAEPLGASWVVHAWVKQGILLAFRNAEP